MTIIQLQCPVLLWVWVELVHDSSGNVVLWIPSTPFLSLLFRRRRPGTSYKSVGRYYGGDHPG